MERQRVEVLLGIELGLECKTKLNKSSLKAYLESKIKGLRVISYRSFAKTKDSIRAEISTNLLALLSAEEAFKGELLAPNDTSSPAASTLLTALRDLLSDCTDKKKRQVLVEHIEQTLNTLENLCMEACEQHGKVANENLQLKTSLDNMCALDPATFGRFIPASSPQPPNPELQAENARLQVLVKELEEKLHKVHRHANDEIFLGRIAELERELKNNEAILALERQEAQEKVAALSLQILACNEKFQELENALASNSQADLVRSKQEVDTLRTKCQNLEAICSQTDTETKLLQERLCAQEAANTQLTGKLAEMLTVKNRLEEQVKQLSLAVPRHRKCVSLIPAGDTDSVESKATSDSNPLRSSEEPPSRSLKLVESDRGISMRPALSQSVHRTEDLPSALTKMTGCLAEREEQLVKLRKEIQEQRLTFESEHKQTLAEVEMLKHDKESLQEHINTLMGTQEQQKEAAKKIADFANQLEDTRLRLQKAEDDNKRLMEVIEIRNSNLTAKEDRCLQYEIQKEQLEKKLIALQDQLTRAKETRAALETSTTTLKAQVKELQGNVAMLEIENHQTTERLMKCEKELLACNGSLPSFGLPPATKSNSTTEGTRSSTAASEHDELLHKLKQAEEANALLAKRAEGIFNAAAVQGMRTKLEELQRKAASRTSVDEMRRLLKALLSDLDVAVFSGVSATSPHLPTSKPPSRGEEPSQEQSEVSSTQPQDLQEKDLQLGRAKAEMAKLTEENKAKGDKVIEQTRRGDRLQREVDDLNMKLKVLERLCVATKTQGGSIKLVETPGSISSSGLGSKASEQHRKCESTDEGKLKPGTSRRGGSMGFTIDELTTCLKELVAVHKTLSDKAKERAEELNAKIERVGLYETIATELSDPQISLEKVKSIVRKAVLMFPYLEKFDLKSDLKFVLTCVLQLIAHKTLKAPRYKEDRDRQQLLVDKAAPTIQAYSVRLSSLLRISYIRFGYSRFYYFYSIHDTLLPFL